MSGVGQDSRQATVTPAPGGPPDPPGHGFTESQQAGVAAVIGLAQVAAANAPPAATQPGTPAPDPLPATGAQATREHKGPGLAHPQVLLLIAILTVQALLSLRLVWSNTAYIDEATYLWGGHLEIAHWLHGTSVPPFQTWLSGAPVIYPPIGALAVSIGGVVGARILSLVFMLGVTALLWGISLRLFGSRAAFFAAAIFAVLGPTQFLGALATYDALALLLMATATWCVVAARDHRDSTVLIVLAAVVLALANATKYATTLFDPVVVALAALVIADKRGTKPALGRAGYLAALVAALVAALLALGGPLYLSGVMYTTLARAAGDNSPLLVLENSAKWVGVVWVLAWIGVIMCVRRGTRAQVMLLAVLATAGLLAPMEQARIHTITSLHKHVDFGAWLAAPAAGYALAQLSRISKHRSLNALAAAFVAVVAVVPAGMVGLAQAKILYNGWPNSAAVMTRLTALTRDYPGQYLAEDYDIPAYYLESSVPWPRWSDTWFFSYRVPGTRRSLTGAAAYRQAIDRHYFSLVLLDFGATPRLDSQITADLQQAGGYQIVAVMPSSSGQYTIWAHRPDQLPGQPRGHS